MYAGDKVRALVERVARINTNASTSKLEEAAEIIALLNTSILGTTVSSPADAEPKRILPSGSRGSGVQSACSHDSCSGGRILRRTLALFSSSGRIEMRAVSMAHEEEGSGEGAGEGAALGVVLVVYVCRL